LIVKRSVIVLLSATVLSGFVPLASAETKIGVVNIARLAQESPQAKEANDKLAAEFTARAKEIQTQEQALQARQDRLNKDAVAMTEIQKSAADKELRDGYRDLQAKKSAFEDDLNARKQDEQGKISRALDAEVSAFAKAQGYDLILADGVVFATTALDVTPAILQAMLAHKATPAAAAPAAGAPPANKPPASIAKP
jgi:outer membrane protein